MSERLNDGRTTAFSGPVDGWYVQEFSSQMSSCKDKDDTHSESSEGSEDLVAQWFSLVDQLALTDLKSRLRTSRDRRSHARAQSRQASKVVLPPGVLAALQVKAKNQ